MTPHYGPPEPLLLLGFALVMTVLWSLYSMVFPEPMDEVQFKRLMAAVVILLALSVLVGWATGSIDCGWSTHVTEACLDRMEAGA